MIREKFHILAKYIYSHSSMFLYQLELLVATNKNRLGISQMTTLNRRCVRNVNIRSRFYIVERKKKGFEKGFLSQKGPKGWLIESCSGQMPT